MRDYENVTVSAGISVKLKLLKDFDMVALKKGYKRSTMISMLMQRVVDKDKSDSEKKHTTSGKS